MKTKLTYIEKLPRSTLKEFSINGGYDCLLTKKKKMSHLPSPSPYTKLIFQMSTHSV